MVQIATYNLDNIMQASILIHILQVRYILEVKCLLMLKNRYHKRQKWTSGVVCLAMLQGMVFLSEERKGLDVGRHMTSTTILHTVKSSMLHEA
jgi:hypothetical protein